MAEEINAEMEQAEGSDDDDEEGQLSEGQMEEMMYVIHLS
jgi:hypothetical protein